MANYNPFDLPPYILGDHSDGYLDYYHAEVNQTLRTWLSSNGWTMPPLTQAQITTIAPSMPNGSIWYDSTNDVYVGKQAGSLVKFTTTAWP